MKHKKKDRPVVDESKLEFERLQADHEMFLQAFEKPTQIYRYLRSRFVVSPIMLQRTLYYMKDRATRKKNTRRNFKIDSILEKVEAKYQKSNPNYSYKREFMNLAFSGFYDQCSHTLQAEVEVFLLKICHKKRKDVSSPVQQISLGKVIVPVNPDTNTSPVKLEGVSVSSNHFNHSNCHTVKSYALLLHVCCVQSAATNTTSPALVNGVCNGQSTVDEPCVKRRRHGSSAASDPTPPVEAAPPVDPPESEPDNLYCTEHMSDSGTVYRAELVVYDKLQRCQLTDGEYELALQEVRAKTPSKKLASWETVLDGRAVGPFEVFNKCPTIKFRLNWNRLPLEEQPPESECDDCQAVVEVAGNRVIVPKNYIPQSDQRNSRRKECLSPSKRRRIFYQFLYNNNTRQQTEARDDLHCPWCSLPCPKLYPLLKHLRTFHARFNFTYVEHPKGARIDVSINQCYDGAYVGNPQDLHSHIGYAFSRNGPVRRTPVTHLLVYRPKRPKLDLAEFMEPESESHSTRQVMQGHNRLYFHTVTCQPVRACEIENDSEDENDPLWLRQKTINMIDEFTDVNEGEKEVMKMWNLHVMHHNILGDCQVERACVTFVEEYGAQILQQNLVRNFILHLVNLFDFDLLRPEVMYKTMMFLLQLRNRLEALGHLTHGSTTRFQLDSALSQQLQQEIIRSSVSQLAAAASPAVSVPSPSSSSQPEDTT